MHVTQTNERNRYLKPWTTRTEQRRRDAAKPPLIRPNAICTCLIHAQKIIWTSWLTTRPRVVLDQRSGFRHDPVLLSKAAATTDNNSERLLSSLISQTSLFGDLRTTQFLNSLEEPDLQDQLPAFIRPLPAKIEPEDVKYLAAKGALTLPPIPLQNALLQAYVEYVFPYMPLLDLNTFLACLNSRDGLCGQTSLLLYQAVMFVATSFVDLKALRENGFPSRKAARKSFFQKTRVSQDSTF
jgi:hypothetical protein